MAAGRLSRSVNVLWNDRRCSRILCYIIENGRGRQDEEKNTLFFFCLTTKNSDRRTLNALLDSNIGKLCRSIAIKTVKRHTSSTIFTFWPYILSKCHYPTWIYVFNNSYFSHCEVTQRFFLLIIIILLLLRAVAVAAHGTLLHIRTGQPFNALYDGGKKNIHQIRQLQKQKATNRGEEKVKKQK